MAIEYGAGSTVGQTATQSAAFGVSTFGSGRLLGATTYTYESISAPEETDDSLFYDTPYGVGSGYNGGRIWSKPVIRQVSTVLPEDGGGMEIVFYEKGGGVIGRIGTDAQRNILQSIEWTEDAMGGNGDALIKLSDLPTFPVLPFSEVSIRFGRVERPQYRGTLQYDPLDGTTQDHYEFRISGLREQLENVRAETIASGPADVGQTFYDIASSYVAGNTTIRVSDGPITTATGALHQANLDLGKDKVARVFDTFAIMASSAGNAYNWYVDGQSLLRFEAESSATVKTFLVGYNVLKFQPERDVEQVKNSIIVKRQNTSGSGESGWTISANSPYTDTSSQAKFGVRELTVQVPGYFDDDDCDTVGQQILADRKDVSDSAKLEINIESADDLLERGTYRCVSARGEYATEIVDPDTAAGWSKFGSGDLSVGFSTTTVLSGSGALELSYTSANGDRAQYTTSSVIRGGLKKIRAYVRASRTGTYLTFGVGESAWNDYTQPVTIGVSNNWNLFEWDVSDFDPSVGVIGVQVDESLTNTVYIDRIEAILADNKHYTLRFTRARYKWKPGTGIRATVELGPLQPNLENYIKQLVRLDADREVAGEVR